MKTIVDELKRIRTGAIGGVGITTFTGICGNVGFQVFDIWDDHKDEFFMSWEHYSGNISFPIPVTDEDEYEDAEDQYYGYEIWEGKQLEMRISLLDHLIKCFGELS